MSGERLQPSPQEQTGHKNPLVVELSSRVLPIIDQYARMIRHDLSVFQHALESTSLMTGLANNFKVILLVA